MSNYSSYQFVASDIILEEAPSSRNFIYYMSCYFLKQTQENTLSVQFLCTGFLDQNGSRIEIGGSNYANTRLRFMVLLTNPIIATSETYLPLRAYFYNPHLFQKYWFTEIDNAIYLAQKKFKSLKQVIERSPVEFLREDNMS